MTNRGERPPCASARKGGACLPRIPVLAVFVALLVGVCLLGAPEVAAAATGSGSIAVRATGHAPATAAVSVASVSPAHATSLESAASRAGETGRKVAMSLIGLAFAVAAIVLAFRRDFKEAAGVFAVGLLAVLLATPAGVSLLKSTVKALVG